ncbi:MAG: hypothetical protein PHE54_04020 [Bacilli bacterium]|nr:hypothetical protein [Bacilli bacterium]
MSKYAPVYQPTESDMRKGIGSPEPGRGEPTPIVVGPRFGINNLESSLASQQENGKRLRYTIPKQF